MAINTFKLTSNCSKEQINYNNSNAIPRKAQFKKLQERAYNALELALNIQNLSHNVYLSGDSTLDRSFFIKSFLEANFKKLPSPPDIIYVYNFEEHNKAMQIKLPAGLGSSFKQSLADILLLIRKEFIKQIESDSFYDNKQKLRVLFSVSKNQLIEDIRLHSTLSGFHIDIDDSFNATLYPIKNNIRITEDDFLKLTKKEQKKYNSISEIIIQKVAKLKHTISKEELKVKKAEKQLEKQVIETILTLTLDPYIEKFLNFYIKKAENQTYLLDIDYEIGKVSNYLKNIRKDLLDNFDIFIQKDMHNNFDNLSENTEIQIIKYEINLFVDNAKTKNVPFIFEQNPNMHKLFGFIEKEPELASLSSDFTHIKAGSIHKAIGGFLVIYINDIVQNPTCWDNLLNTLKSQKISVNEYYEQSESAKTKNIEVEEIPLDIKIILIGNDEMYENLLENDERFIKFFKIKAQMRNEIARNSKNIQAFLSHLAIMIDEINLLPISQDGLMYIIDYASYLINDQKSLSLEFSKIQELLIEANYYAKRNTLQFIDASALEEAHVQNNFRKNLIEEEYFEEFLRDSIKIYTTGEQIGTINALSVISYSNFEFGLPHQISCAVSVGQDGLISLEREVEQSGAIHAKAILILKSFINKHFAHNKSLTFNATLYFEQSYIGIDGDSASLAELICLLTTIADIPILQSIACTGSVNQDGKIYSIGGINQKIEAFYKICKLKGFNNKHGIIIPYDNIDNLMLNKEIIESVENGLFTIYPVKDISEAIKIYTGLSTGKLRKDGTYTENSLYSLVDKKLKELGYFAQIEYKKYNKKQ